MIIKEILGGNGEFFFRQLEKLVNADALWFEDKNGHQYKVKKVEKVSDEGGQLQIWYALFYIAVADSTNLRTRMIKMTMLDEFYTLKRDESSGENRIVLQRKQLKESVDYSMPLKVSMLLKLVRAHFKQGTAKVVLRDNEYDITDKLIRGAAWRFGALEVYIDDSNHLRQIIYPIDIIENGIKLWKNKEEDYWVLEYL